jgi:hypothetical protein
MLPQQHVFNVGLNKEDGHSICMLFVLLFATSQLAQLQNAAVDVLWQL